MQFFLNSKKIMMSVLLPPIYREERLRFTYVQNCAWDHTASKWSLRIQGSLSRKSFPFHFTILPIRKNKGEIQRLGSTLGWVSGAIFFHRLRSFDQSGTCSQRTPDNDVGIPGCPRAMVPVPL